MSIDKKIVGLCKPYNDIRVVEVNLHNKTVSVILPYESAVVDIDVTGDSDSEIIKSFKDGVNYRLEAMRDHLEDCKFD